MQPRKTAARPRRGHCLRPLLWALMITAAALPAADTAGAEADWTGYFWGDGRRPAVAAYWERLQTRPSYRTEILEARCPITLQGIEDVKQAKASDPALRQALEGAWTGGARNPG